MEGRSKEKGVEMSRKSITREIPATDFSEIEKFVREILEKFKASSRSEIETMLVFEALYNDIIDQILNENTVFSISGERILGETRILIGFEGDLVTYPPENKRMKTEKMVMKAYADKIDHSYHAGYNYFSIVVDRNYSRSLVSCFIGIIMAFVSYIPMAFFMSEASRHYLLEEVVFPVEQIFADVMLLVGSAVTIFSLLNNMSDVFILSKRNSTVRRVYVKAMASSVFAIVLAISWGFFADRMMKDFFNEALSGYSGVRTVMISELLSDFRTNSSSPFPVIIYTLLIIYAMCSAGKYLDPIKKVIDGLYVLSSKILGLIMYTLPFFCALSILDVLLEDGMKYIFQIVSMALFIICSVSLIGIYYILRLKYAKVPVIPFIKKMPKLLKENLAINSSIFAVPYNIRYCTTQYGMNRKSLEKSIPILAEVNLDGNCFIIMMAVVVLFLSSDMTINMYRMIGVALLILFLSLGAPNQPGSCLIGLLITLQYLEMTDLVCVAIYMEVFLGWLVNLVNVTGDIVTVATEDVNAKLLRQNT